MPAHFYKSVMRKALRFHLEMFYSDGEGANTFRLGFSRLKEEEIVRGIKIIGDTLKMKFGVEKMKIGVIMGGVSSENKFQL